MNEPPQPTGEIAEELLKVVGYFSPITTYTARHVLSRWIGWSVYFPEYKKAREQLLDLDMIEFDTPPGSGEITITNQGMDALARRESES